MDDQKLWNLLGRSPRQSAPPFFAAKVVRQIETGATRPPWLAIFLRWLAPAAVAALAIFALLPRSSAPEPGTYDELTTLDIVEMVSPDDYMLLTSAGGIEDDNILTSER